MEVERAREKKEEEEEDTVKYAALDPLDQDRKLKVGDGEGGSNAIRIAQVGEILVKHGEPVGEGSTSKNCSHFEFLLLVLLSQRRTEYRGDFLNGVQDGVDESLKGEIKTQKRCVTASQLSAG
jgi:hypothetical protein